MQEVQGINRSWASQGSEYVGKEQGTPAGLPRTPTEGHDLAGHAT